MTTKFEADVAAAYKMVDERVEIICAVATRLLDMLDHSMCVCTPLSAEITKREILRLMAELRRVMR